MSGPQSHRKSSRVAEKALRRYAKAGHRGVARDAGAVGSRRVGRAAPTKSRPEIDLERRRAACAGNWVAMTSPCDAADYRILSDEAVVVSGYVKCWNCKADIEVICLYCQSGFVEGEATAGLQRFEHYACRRIIARDSCCAGPGFIPSAAAAARAARSRTTVRAASNPRMTSICTASPAGFFSVSRIRLHRNCGYTHCTGRCGCRGMRASSLAELQMGARGPPGR